MKKVLLAACLFGIFLVSGCTHQMHITNADDYFSPPRPPLAKPIKLGVTSGNSADVKNGRYVSAVVDALQRSGNFERVLYPFNLAANQGQADMLVDIAINPKYDGSGQNFVINFPGFLIFAPAIWGYKYDAEIDTRVGITNLTDNTSKQIAVPTHYIFRHADMGRTWTEVSWFEVGIIALVGGIAFTGYDNDVTPEFITAVSPNYGSYVSKKIVDALASFPTTTTLQSAPTATTMSLR
jgi:hypothetical protein